MFSLSSKLKIGKYSFVGGFKELKIRRSINEIMDTASIELPTLSRVEEDKPRPGQEQASGDTASLFEEGNEVSIELGYNGDLKQEFKGFVRRINSASPISLELEGYGWQLRRKNISISKRNTSLREVLEEVVRGTDILLSDKIPDVKLEKFSLPNKTGLEVLEYLKNQLFLTVYFNFNVLYAGIQQGDLKGTAKYRLGWNVIKDNQLKFRRAEDVKVLVRVKRKLVKDENQVYEVGDKDGAIHTITLPNVSKDDVKAIGDKALAQTKYTGYEGKIKGFLQPYCEPGYKSVIIDPRYAERGGAFFTKSTEVTFGMGGARRIVEISNKLDG